MKLYIKQHIFSWGDKFSVYDENGNERYYVRGEVFSFGKKLRIYDLGDRELIYIEQKLFTFLPKYQVTADGRELCEIVREFTFFKQEYTVNGLGWSVRGDFFSHEFGVFGALGQVASVSKEWFTLGDAYCIDIDDPRDTLAALAVVIVIDAVMDQDDNHDINISI